MGAEKQNYACVIGVYIHPVDGIDEHNTMLNKTKILFTFTVINMIMSLGGVCSCIFLALPFLPGTIKTQRAEQMVWLFFWCVDGSKKRCLTVFRWETASVLIAR